MAEPPRIPSFKKALDSSYPAEGKLGSIRCKTRRNQKEQNLDKKLILQM